MATSSQQQQQQPRILNRVSGFFMHHSKKKQASDEDTSSSSSSDDISLPPESSTHDGASSRVDSMFSSISSVRGGNPNSPPPVRTIRLDNPVVHESPPSPPSMTSTSKKRKQKLDPKQVDEAFDQLLQEYALASNIRPTLTQLTTEQKSMLLQSSKSRMLLRKNSTFSSSSSASQFFAPLANTFGIKKKQQSPQIPFFSSPDNNPSPSPSPPLEQQFHEHRVSPPAARRRHSNAADKSNGSGSARSKLKSSPEYFVHLLRDTSVRELEFADVVDLRVFLRNVVVSWTTEFLALGGYEALGDKFRQMKELPKRMPQDDRILQQLTKCFKAIMTHEANGTEKVLTSPAPLYYIRDLLFGPTNQKLKAVYGLHISTRAELLNLLCTLPSLQVTTASGRYVHGYDVLRELLLDQPTDQPEEPAQKSYPFPMTLKADPQTVMRIILDEDGTARTTPVAPRYTAWMREIQHTVDKHIEPITFLAQVLDYNFESAFKQLKIRSQQQQQQQENATTLPESSSVEPISPGLVMVDEGVVDYLITHLRLICTLVTTPPTNFRGKYNEYEQEKMRLEIMLSGFDKISKALQTCPHPTLYASYIRYLQPLLQPWADLAIPTSSSPRNSTITQQLAAPQQQHIRQERAWRQQTIRSLTGNNYQRDMLRWEQDLRVMDTTIVQDDERPDGANDDDEMWEDMDDNFDDIFDNENDDDDENDDDEYDVDDHINERHGHHHHHHRNGSSF